MDTQHQRVEYEHTSPLWRVAAIALAAGSIAALGFWAQAVERADDFATILVIAAFCSIGFWAERRPDRLRMRLGPFGKIAEAIRESRGDLRQWVNAKPYAVGLAIFAGYGVAVVLAQHLVVALMTSIYSWHLAVAVGAAVAAVAAEPRLFQSIKDKLAGPPDDEPEDTGNETPVEYEDPPDEPPPKE